MFRDRRLEDELTLDALDPRAAAETFGDLTSYLREPIEQIAAAYWQYRQTADVAAQERVARATEAGDVLAYYRATPHYLYELSYWEASRDKQAWYRVIRQAARTYGLRRLLDYGGGVGGSVIQLRRHGIDCDYLDVGGKTFEYAAWRFARRSWDVPMWDILAGRPRGEYDAVMAWDVLEHIFDLEEALGQMAGLIRPGGWLLSKSTFAVTDGHHLHIHLARHARYADVREFNRLVSGSDFRFIGQLKPDRLSRLLRAIGLRHAVAGVRIAHRLKHGGNFLVHERLPGARAAQLAQTP
jgi:SAM-dependent methyltransferase